MNDIVKVLYKSSQTPGLCSAEEISLANSYYTDLVEKLDIFKQAHNHDVVGLTAHSYLQNLQYFVDKFKEK